MDAVFFAVIANHGYDEWAYCREVLFCDTLSDFCLVELDSLSDGSSLSDHARPLVLNGQELAQNGEEEWIAIGNADGEGIQGSSGPRGERDQEGRVFHYAPTLSGSSGSPLLNEKGQVVALNYGGSERGRDNVGPVNVAIPISYILKRIKQVSLENRHLQERLQKNEINFLQ